MRWLIKHRKRQKVIDTTALFYESTATKELTGVKSVFAGVNNTTIEV